MVAAHRAGDEAGTPGGGLSASGRNPGASDGPGSAGPLCDWVEKGAEWLQPIVREMKRELLAGDYLQVDETPVRVMDPEVRGRCATGYLWVAGRPNQDVIFEFHPGRGK